MTTKNDQKKVFTVCGEVFEIERSGTWSAFLLRGPTDSKTSCLKVVTTCDDAKHSQVKRGSIILVQGNYLEKFTGGLKVFTDDFDILE